MGPDTSGEGAFDGCWLGTAEGALELGDSDGEGEGCAEVDGLPVIVGSSDGCADGTEEGCVDTEGAELG